MLPIEPRHLVTSRANIFRYKHAEAPRLVAFAARQKIASRVLELLQPRKWHDEPAEGSSIWSVQVGRVALESRSHVLAGRRKESRVVDQTSEQRVDRFHVSDLSISA